MKKIYLIQVMLFAFLSGISQNVMLDPGFGINGIAKTDFPLNESFDYHLAKKILASDDGTSFLLFEVNDRAVIVHFKEDGSINTAYGENGYSIPAKMKPQSASLQNDGKIVVAGYADLTSGNGFGFVLARFGIDGTLDPTFGNGGTIQTAFVYNGSSSRGIANAVALQNDGKIVVGGQSDEANGPVFTLARYNTDGSLDASFDGDGKVFSLINDSRIQDLKLQSDGRIIAAGYSTTSWGTEFTIARYNSDGSPDHGFDGDGVVQTPFSYNGSAANAYANSMALQSDGKIVIAGHSAVNGVAAFTLARYKSDGSLDESFDEDGKSQTNSPYNGIEFFDVFNSVTIQSNGKIVAAGLSRFPPYLNLFAVARFDTDGSLDESFGENGMSFTSLSDPNSNCQAYSVVLQGNEKILVAGISNINIYSNSAYAVARYNTDGSLDDSFDEDGKKVDFIKTGSSSFSAVAVQSDRKIMAVGTGRLDDASSGFALSRFNSDGSLDAGFDGDGKVVTSFGIGADFFGRATAVVLQNDGKIIAGGNSSTDQGTVFTLCRYDQNGNLDVGFDGDGKVQTPFFYQSDKSNTNLTCLVVQNDGKIVAAGANRSDVAPFNSVFTLARYNVDGSLDVNFDGDGKLQTIFTNNGQNASAAISAVAIQTDGKILAAGGAPVGSTTAFVIARYNPDGSIDESFDNDGKAEIPFPSSTPYSISSVSSILVQTDGKIILAGSTLTAPRDDGPRSFSVARLNPDGSMDASFDGDGKLQTVISYNGNNIPSYARSVSLQSDGKIIVAGNSGYIRSGSANGLTVVRYNPDGNLDAGFENNGISTTWIDKADFHTLSNPSIVNNRIFYAGVSIYYGPMSSVAALLIKGIDDDDDGIANALDCAPADKTKWRSAELYIDADGDGFDAGKSLICYGAALPDGYSEIASGSDCDDNNKLINGDATEVCGNNIDEDCDGLVDEGCAVTEVPRVYISNASIREGNHGTKDIVFVLTLDKTSNESISLKYQTVSNTAKSPDDFIHKSGTVVFPPNTRTQVLRVQVKGEKTNEADEFFSIQLYQPVNGVIAVASAMGTIVNDDPLPSLLIDDASANESSKLASVRVRLSKPSGQIVKVKYYTEDESATAPADYEAINNGLLVFQPGETIRNINVVIKEDAIREGHEKFVIKFKEAENVKLPGKDAKVTIINSPHKKDKQDKNESERSTDKDGLLVYPNPVDQELTIRLGKPINNNSQLELVDQNGKVVKRWVGGFSTKGQSIQIATGDIASGIYLIVLKDSKGRFELQKVVIQH